MKRNSNCDSLPKTRNLSDFLAQVVTNTPSKDKAVSTPKKFKTTPQPLNFGSGANFKVERRNKRLSSANIISRLKNDSITTTISNSSFFDKVSPQSKPEIKQETNNSDTPSGTESRTDTSTIKVTDSPNQLLPVPIKSENTNKSFTEYINSVNTSFTSCPLQASGDSLGNWIKTAVRTTPSINDSIEGDLNTRKRKKKLVSDGFAEYIKILSPRLASDVHMWYYSVKQDTHLKSIDIHEIITACIETIHIQGTLYNATCSVIDPVPDKIAENEYFQACNRLTVIFTHQTVEMLRIKSKSCVKICPPWTFLLVGPLNSPVILCTYFSFLGDSSFPIPKQFQTNPPSSVPINLWRSTQDQDLNHKTNKHHVTSYNDTDTELQLLQHTLKTALKSQGWEYLTLSGTVVHVTHVLNPRELSDTQVTQMNLDQHFHIFLRDSNDIVCVISLPSPILDKDSIQSYQLFNSIVLLKSIKVLSRVNKLTSPRVMSIVQTLAQGQSCCYMLSAGLNSELEMLKANLPYTERNYLTKLSENTADDERSRVSLVGRLQHTQLEVPLPTQDGDIEEHSRPLSGCYLFLLGVNSNLFQVYLEPVLTRSFLHTLQAASGRLFYLGSLFVSRITQRPTCLHADQYSLLLEMEKAGLILGPELLERVKDSFYCVTRVPYPLFDEDYRLGSMVCVRGNIVDVVEECAYVWQVCGVCGEGVEESSQQKGFYCHECQKMLTNPMDKYNLDLIIQCTNIDSTQLIVHLHDDTIKNILPGVADGKIYDKVEVKGRKIDIECCYVQEKRVLPSGLTKVYLVENKHFLNM